ncbi:MAG TPA: hypothetical protein VEB41_12160 [Burkholderiales bacterium]|nr:hypothetical protein [Burkholderiales bacterium]
MASTIQSAPPYNRRATDRYGAGPAVVRTEGLRVSWGGVWGGVLLAVGLLVLLTALGAAIGITAAEPGQTDAGTAGRAAGIYGAVALLLALFFGGWAATRMGAIVDRATGFCEGALVWVVSVLLIAALGVMGLGNLLGGALSLAGNASQAAATAAQTPQGSQQVENASSGASQAIGQAKDKVGELMGRAQSGELEQRAAQAKPAAQRGAWITFGALVLSLLTAVIGAMAGRRDPLDTVSR